MSEKKRSYKYSPRRDTEPVRKLGRMSNLEYNTYIREKSGDALHKREYHNKDLRRLTETEYKNITSEIYEGRTLAYAHYKDGGARERKAKQ